MSNFERCLAFEGESRRPAVGSGRSLPRLSPGATSTTCWRDQEFDVLGRGAIGIFATFLGGGGSASVPSRRLRSTLCC